MRSLYSIIFAVAILFSVSIGFFAYFSPYLHISHTFVHKTSSQIRYESSDIPDETASFVGYFPIQGLVSLVFYILFIVYLFTKSSKARHSGNHSLANIYLLLPVFLLVFSWILFPLLIIFGINGNPLLDSIRLPEGSQLVAMVTPTFPVGKMFLFTIPLMVFGIIPQIEKPSFTTLTKSSNRSSSRTKIQSSDNSLHRVLALLCLILAFCMFPVVCLFLWVLVMWGASDGMMSNAETYKGLVIMLLIPGLLMAWSLKIAVQFYRRQLYSRSLWATFSPTIALVSIMFFIGFLIPILENLHIMELTSILSTLPIVVTMAIHVVFLIKWEKALRTFSTI